MIGLMLLGGYAALLGWAVPGPLASARWTTRAPQLAIRLWQALSVSWLAALVLIGAVLMHPWLRFAIGAGRLSTAAVLSSAVGAAVAAAVVLRFGCVAARDLHAVRRTQRWHAAAVTLVGDAMPGQDAVIVEQDTAAVYCLPASRRHRRIVVTTGAVNALRDEHLDAVLAHERAHLRLRHHQLLARSAVLARSFPVRLLRDARREIAILAEMAADDAAARAYGRPALAAALVTLARASTPGAALAAGGHDTVHRVERLLAPPTPLGLPWRLAGTGTAAGALAVPGALACTTVAAIATLLAI